MDTCSKVIHGERPRGNPGPVATPGTLGVGARYLKYFTYQPESRFWHFQFIEGGWLLVLSLLLAAATIWLVRRRAA